MKNLLKFGWGHKETSTDTVEQLVTAKAKTKEVDMTFEEIKDEVRKRFPGTTVVNTNTSNTDVYISYKPLDISVEVPYCKNIDIFCNSYAKLLMSKVQIVVEEVEENTRKRREWNKYELEDVEFIRKGKVVVPPEKISQDFAYTGLMTTDFVSMYNWDKEEW